MDCGSSPRYAGYDRKRRGPRAYPGCMETEVRHEPAEQRYALYVGATRACVLDYRELGTSVSFTHTFTLPPYRGRGLAGELVSYAVADVVARGFTRIVPTCWYVAQWFTAHPDAGHLLNAG